MDISKYDLVHKVGSIQSVQKRRKRKSYIMFDNESHFKNEFFKLVGYFD